MSLPDVNYMNRHSQSPFSPSNSKLHQGIPHCSQTHKTYNMKPDPLLKSGSAVCHLNVRKPCLTWLPQHQMPTRYIQKF